jgi:ATP-dependent protease HslVU (ClpYQ) peptidase subunit
MTIIIAQTEGDKVYVGTDSRYSYGDDFFTDFGHKFIETEIRGLILAAGGDDGVHAILSEVLEMWEGELDSKALDIDVLSLRTFAQMVRSRMQFYKVGDAKDNELPTHEFGLVIAYQDKLWVMDGHYGIQDWTERGYVCEGSGWQLGMVSMDLMLTNNRKMSAKTRIKKAIEAVCRWNSGCGGEIHIRRT